jgi:hypothetical protein
MIAAARESVRHPSKFRSGAAARASLDSPGLRSEAIVSRSLDPGVRPSALVGSRFGRAFWINRARLSSHAPRES